MYEYSTNYKYTYYRKIVRIFASFLLHAEISMTLQFSPSTTKKKNFWLLLSYGIFWEFVNTEENNIDMLKW